MTMSDGSQVNDTSAVTWSSSSASVYVSTAAASYGTITGVSIGGGVVTAIDPSSGLSASAIVTVSIDTSDSAAQEFSPFVNPIGNWSFGALNGVAFQLAATSGPDGVGDDTWSVPGQAMILHNGTNGFTYQEYTTEYYDYPNFINGYSSGGSILQLGELINYSSYVPPQGLSLNPYGEAADARWTAPTSGVYSVTATFYGEAYESPAPGSCEMFHGCCTPYCHGCIIGQCYCGDDYCDHYTYAECSPYYVACTVLETFYANTTVAVTLNGTPLYSQVVSSNGLYQTFTTTVAVQAGDTLDFSAMANGSPYGPDGRYAATTIFTAQISGGTTCAAPTPPGLGTLVGISLSPPAANVIGGGTTTFEVLGYYSNQPSTPVNVTSQAHWQVSGSDLTVDANGDVSYSGTNIATGSVTATVGTLTTSGGVRVWDPTRWAQIQTLTISASNPNFGTGANFWYGGLGDCADVVDTVSYSDGTSEDVTATTIWGGDQPVVFGNVFDVSRARGGYEVLTATLGGTSPVAQQGLYIGITTTFNGTCTDPRVPGAVWQVFTSPADGSLYTGQATQQTASAYHADGSLRDVTPSTTWLACNSSIVDVSSDGWVTGVAPGSSTILAAVGTMGAVASYGVSPGPTPGNVTSLFIRPSANNLVNGSSFPARTIATYDNLPGYLFNVTPQTVWSTSDPTIVTVLPSLSGPTNTTSSVGIGSATVIATFGSTTTGENIRVWDPTRAAQLTSITPNFGTENPYCIGDQFSNVANFSDGTTEDVTATTQWLPLGNAGYAFVSREGYMSPLGNYTGYLEAQASLGQVQSSLGQSFALPLPGEIGIFGQCPGPSCSSRVLLFCCAPGCVGRGRSKYSSIPRSPSLASGRSRRKSTPC
jgi:hypothetical protein